MADDTEVIDQPPVRPVLPPGSGYTYSTQGPGDFSTTRMIGGPGGVQVPVPVNAQNFAAVQGAPGPVADPQTEMLRNVFNKLPVDQAIKAVQAAHMYQGQRLYQRMLSEGKTSAEALTVAGPLLFGGGINPTELAKFAAIGQKPQMTPYQQQEIEVRKAEIARRAAADRLKASATKPVKEGTMTQQQSREFQMLSTDKAGLQRSLAGITDPAQLKQAQDKITEITDRQNELIGKPKKPSVTGRVKVKNKQGKVGTIPADQLDAALKAGYEKVQ